jgi:hypothetical protein
MNVLARHVHASFMSIIRSLFMKKEVASMLRKIAFAVVFASLTLSLSAARAESASPVNYSRSELKKMVRDAHTPEQYRELACYYRVRQQEFEQQAHDELVWFARRSMNVSLAAAKYPTPTDSSRNRYEYFNYEAGQMGRKAAYYENLQAGANQ